MSERCADHTPSTMDAVWAETASCLLELQQKLDAWDRLDEEERRELRTDLSRVTAHYMREYQAKGPPGQLSQQWRRGRPPAGQHVDVLDSLEERVLPSLVTRVPHPRGDAGLTQRSTLRIAIYSQDGFGLGHLRRSTHIGRCLLEAAPESAVLLFADSPVAPFFELPVGMDCVKLPSILKVDAGRWRPTSLPIPTADLQRLRSGLLYRTLVEYQPDLVLVDHMPGGVQGELRPALSALRQEQPACRIVLGLRDVLDAPDVTRRVWQDEGAYEALRQYYDAVLIYGNRELFDTAATYAIPAPPGGIHYCGYVVHGAQPTGERRQAPGSGPARAPERRLVFVAAGGGGDGQ